MGAVPERAHALRVAWTSTALQRLAQKKPGKFVWMVFAVSKEDLVRMPALHLSYLRAMQEIFASSTGKDCVGLLRADARPGRVIGPDCQVTSDPSASQLVGSTEVS